MDLSAILNVAAIVIAVCSLGFSTWLAARQSLLQERGNASSTLLSLLEEYQSPTFHKRYAYVCRQLSKEHSADLGISGLPEPAQEAVYHYMTCATLVGLGVLNEREVLALIRRRVTTVWDAIGPYVKREAELNPSAGTFSFLDAFTAHARTLPPEPGALALKWRRRGRWTTQRLVPKHWQVTYLNRAQAEFATRIESQDGSGPSR